MAGLFQDDRKDFAKQPFSKAGNGFGNVEFRLRIWNS